MDRVMLRTQMISQWREHNKYKQRQLWLFYMYFYLNSFYIVFCKSCIYELGEVSVFLSYINTRYATQSWPQGLLAALCGWCGPGGLQLTVEPFSAECEAAGRRISTSKSEAVVLSSSGRSLRLYSVVLVRLVFLNGVRWMTVHLYSHVWISSTTVETVYSDNSEERTEKLTSSHFY